MHENEINFTENLVRQLLINQCPSWQALPLERINSSGTENALFRLGNDLVVRLPRVIGSDKNINKEYEWVPKLASFLPFALSEPVFKGKPENEYPCEWLVTKWCDGSNPEFEDDGEYMHLAEDLAKVLAILHSIELTDGPPSRRGLPLSEDDEQTRRAIAELEGEIDQAAVTKLWEQLCQLPEWNASPVWVHGDVLPGNILINSSKRLTALIDFSDVGMGDPACDCIIAWALFNSASREKFRMKLNHIDDTTWQRGKGRALSVALIMLPYYKHTNPVMAILARRILQQIMDES